MNIGVPPHEEAKMCDKCTKQQNAHKNFEIDVELVLCDLHGTLRSNMEKGALVLRIHDGPRAS